MLQMAGRMGVLGTETAFEVLARANALAAAGRSIINLGIGQPDFPTPEHIVEAGGFSFSADEGLDKITPRTRLIIINSPANPTGGVVRRDELERLAAGLERHPHVAVLSDEIYGEILYDGAEHISLLRYPSLRD